MSDRDTYLDDLARNGLKVTTPETGSAAPHTGAAKPLTIPSNKADLIARMGRLGLRRAD